MSTKNSRKVLSVLLAYMMVLSSFSGMAVAAKENTGENGAQAVVSSGPAPDADAADTVLTSTPDAKDVEDMIEDLPDENDLAELDEEYREAAEEAVNEAADAYNALDEDEQEKVDPELLEKLEALQEYFSNEPMLMAGESATVSSLEELKKAIEQKASTITLDNEITTTDNISVNYIVTIDLNGHTLTVGRFDVAAGGDVTLKDSSSDESGVLTSEKSMTIVVFKDGSLTIENGTYSNKYSVKESQPITIFNGGNLTVNGGTIEAITDGTYGNPIYNKITSEDESDSIIKCTINDGLITSNCWGVSIFGKGDYDNDAATLEMTGGEIKIVGDNGGQGICTNASSGKYAGFTINLSGNAKITADVDDGCAMYLPGPGVTNISDSVEIFGKLQGIRIAAGVLNIEGGTITNSSRRQNDSDLISGGSGGTAGAIVAGKASAGYVDDLIINIGNATIENETGGDAIVVSDKNMAGSDYEENKIEVTVSESTINGNVYTTSTIDGNDNDDGGNVSVTLNNSTTIEGDIENTSKSPVTATEINLDGTIIVEEYTEGKVTIIDSTVTKDVNTNENIIIVNSDVNGEQTTTVTEGNIIDNKGNTYNSLDEALGKLEDGMTLIFGEGEFRSSSTITINADDVTILGTGAESIIQNGIMVRGDNVTIENLSVESTGKNVDAIKFSQSGSGDAIKTLTSGTVRNVTLSSDGGHGLNIHGVKTMNVDGLVVKEAGKLSISISNSGTVNISNTVTADVDESHWGGGSDIGIMYTKGSPHYIADQKVTVVLGDGNEFNGTGFYSERGTLEEDPDIISCADGTILYKVLGDDDDEFYHFVESDAIVASIDDETVNPVGYETLEEAIEAANDKEEIDLHQDVKDVTIGKKVTINGNGNAISGEIVVTDDDASITGANLKDATFEIKDGTTINLSGNYWGGEAPPEIEGAVISSYYTDESMTDGVLVGDPLEAVESLLKGKHFTVTSAEVDNDREQTLAWAESQIDELLATFGYQGNYAVLDSGFTPATDGTAENPAGEDGQLKISVGLSYNGEIAEVTDLIVTITAAEYIPEEPTDPDDPDPKPDDNDDDNSSSSGGSSGGGSFIGHPDGWVPGGIIILDGSEQVQPTGSLLLDTKTYTMAPGVVYDILATLEGASENELRVYSSQPGVASVEAIGGGKYRVTGLADGQTYIMFEVWRNGVMLNHASVKVTIADGVTAYGESNREASIF